MVGTTFLVFLIILFMLMEFESFSVKAKVIQHGSDKSIYYFSSILRNIRNYLGIKTLLCFIHRYSYIFYFTDDWSSL